MPSSIKQNLQMLILTDLLQSEKISQAAYDKAVEILKRKNLHASQPSDASIA